MRRALERHEANEARVIPVILEPCDWLNSPLGKLRAAPRDGKPISKHANIHDAFLQVVQDVRKVASEMDSGSAAAYSQRDSADTEGNPEPQAIPRSSNLRVRHEFSDRERDDFLVEAFRYVRVFFENSLAELGERSKDIDMRFYEIDSGRFTASVYADGNRSSACTVWLAREGMLGSGIHYAPGVGEATNSYSESLGIADDGHALFLKPTMNVATLSIKSEFTLQGGAEFLWAMFIRPLQ